MPGNPDILDKLADISDMTPENWKGIVRNIIQPYIQKTKVVRDVLDNIQYYKIALSNLNSEGYIDKFILELDALNEGFNVMKKASLERGNNVDALWTDVKEFIDLFNTTSTSISVFRLKVGEHCLTQVFHHPIRPDLIK